MNRILYIIFFALTLIIMSCKKPYYPPHITPVTGFLVVEGVINAGNDSTRFELSRTVNLDSSTVAPVINAVVTIEGSNNISYPLTDNAAGIYTSAPLNLNQSLTYRLHIITASGEDYKSDYVGVKVTPPIDSVSYQIKSNGLQINLDTHDPANDTRYYRWDFVETWKFHSMYDSQDVSNGDTVLLRTLSQDVYFCYDSGNSNSILLGSSAKLTKDVISQAPITFISSNSEKIETEYSILVNQYALTSDAYSFWQVLKNDTELLGSIFDVQPSEISGNIHSTSNPNEHVIGYVSASTVQTKRIFVYNTSLPLTWKTTYPYTCELDSELFEKNINGTTVFEEDIAFNRNKGGGNMIPVEPILNKMGSIIGHMGSDPYCVDCSLRGTLKQPSFWK